MTCIYDKFDECCGECPGCPREENRVCRYCKAQKDVIFYYGKYICSHCLAEQLIAIEADIVFDFAERHSDLFSLYLSHHFSDEKVSV